MSNLETFKKYTEACTVLSNDFIAALRKARLMREAGAITLARYMMVTDQAQDSYETQLASVCQAYKQLTSVSGRGQ